MGQIELSQYQKDIIDYFNENPGKNMLVEAYAGTAKTFTITKLTENTTSSDVYLAFNNAIAEECRSKIKNPKTKIYTTYALGLAIMNYNLGGKSNGIGQTRTKDSEKAKLDYLKIHKIVDDMITTAYGHRFNWDERNFLKNNYVTLYSLARITRSLDDRDKIQAIVDNHGLFIDLENGFMPPDNSVICGWLWDIDKASLELFEEEHVIDFTDMLYITIKNLESKKWQNAPWFYFTNIYCDEFQDLSDLQFELLKYIKRKNGRYICVGDSYQAIYNFAGANAQSFKKAKEYFKPKQFELPINYRCPASHIQYVNDRFDIPIQARPNAPEGSIKTITKQDIVKYVKPGDMIISRKNKWFAPLLLQLATQGIPVYIEDKEMVESIKKNIRAQKVTGCSGLKHKFTEIYQTYQKNISNLIKKSQSADNDMDINDISVKINSINSRLDTITFTMSLLDPYMAKHTNALVDQFLVYLDKILNTTPGKDCVRICSVHKAKGLEAPNVFVLNEAKVCNDFRMSKEQREQEVNLAYISVTRAMENLYLVVEEDA